MSEVTFTLKINKHIVIGLVIGLIVGSCATLLIGGVSFGKDKEAAVPSPAPTADAGGDKQPSVVQINLTNDDHIRGNKDAKVVLVEYSDFECPYCGRHHPTMKKIFEKYGDKIAWVYRHFPLSFHPQSTPAALASECASEQGKFWEYMDGLFSNQASLGDVYYNKLASDLGLDAKKFSDCYASQKYKDRVNKDYTQGQTDGVEGTPATFINGVLVSGAVPEAQLSSIIDQQLAK